jgi:hypothetical protein
MILNHQEKSVDYEKIKAATNPGSKFHSFGQQLRYFFGQQKFFFFWAARLFIWAANFISKDSRFYRDWQQFLLKWAANIFFLKYKNDGYII